MCPSETPHPSGENSSRIHLPLGGLTPSWNAPIVSPSGTPHPSGENSSRTGVENNYDDMDLGLLDADLDVGPIDSDENNYDDVNLGLLDADLDVGPIDPEDVIEWTDDEEIEFSAPLPSSADPDQSLSASPAMGTALAEISSGAPASRTRRNERRPAGDPNPLAKLRELFEAKRQVEATRKAEADKAAVFNQLSLNRLSRRDRPFSDSASTATGKKTKSDYSTPGPNAKDTTGGKPARNRPTSSMQSFGSPSTSRPTSQKPTKPSKSPAELEMLRLKDRRTLHSLAR